MNACHRRLLTALAAACLSNFAAAQSAPHPGYLDDAERSIVRSGSGLCWHVSAWSAADPSEACDPAPQATPVPPVALPAARPAVTAAAAPLATPLPVAPPAVVAVLPRRISFSGDALFDFDRATLRPQGRAMLDGLVLQLEGAVYDSIQATGHTDRFGSDAYNQKLSQRRAQAVKDYLVERRIDAARIEVEGRGETQPMTVAGQCLGGKSDEVVACLQPDRRVDVEMRGSSAVTGSR